MCRCPSARAFSGISIGTSGRVSTGALDVLPCGSRSGNHAARHPSCSRISPGSHGRTCPAGVGAGHKVHGRGPLLGRLLQALAYEPEYALRHALQVRLLLAHPEQPRVQPDGVAAERGPPGRRVREDGAEAEHVALRADFEPAHLLGRHETGGADDGPGAGTEAVVGNGVQGAGDAEVDDAGAVDGDEDIGRLQVPVRETGVVDGPQGEREPVREDEQRALRQRAVVGDDGLEVGTRYVAGGDPGCRRTRVEVQDRRGSVTAHAPRGVDLPRELLPEVVLPGELGPHDLHGDGPSPFGARETYSAHTPFSEHPEKPIGPYRTRIARAQIVRARTIRQGRMGEVSTTHLLRLAFDWFLP